MKLSHLAAALLAVLILSTEKRRFRRMSRRRINQIAKNRRALAMRKPVPQ